MNTIGQFTSFKELTITMNDDTAKYLKSYFVKYIENLLLNENVLSSFFMSLPLFDFRMLNNENTYIIDVGFSSGFIFIQFAYRFKSDSDGQYYYSVQEQSFLEVEESITFSCSQRYYKNDITSAIMDEAAFLTLEKEMMIKILINMPTLEVLENDIITWQADAKNVYKFIRDYRNNGFAVAVGENWLDLDPNSGYCVNAFEPKKFILDFFDSYGKYVSSIIINDDSVTWDAEECKLHSTLVFPDSNEIGLVAQRILSEYYGDKLDYTLAKRLPSDPNDLEQKIIFDLLNEVKPIDTALVEKIATQNALTEQYNDNIRWLGEVVNKLNKYSSLESNIPIVEVFK